MKTKLNTLETNTLTSELKDKLANLETKDLIAFLRGQEISVEVPCFENNIKASTSIKELLLKAPNFNSDDKRPVFSSVVSFRVNIAGLDEEPLVETEPIVDTSEKVVPEVEVVRQQVIETNTVEVTE